MNREKKEKFIRHDKKNDCHLISCMRYLSSNRIIQSQIVMYVHRARDSTMKENGTNTRQLHLYWDATNSHQHGRRAIVNGNKCARLPLYHFGFIIRCSLSHKVVESYIFIERV